MKIQLIREQDPLKQGLKPPIHMISPLILYDSRARSTKTRIETQFLLLLEYTDIIREQDPLKQGLKLQYSTGIPAPRLSFASKIH